VVSGSSFEVFVAIPTPEIVDVASLAPLRDMAATSFRFTTNVGERPGFTKAADALFLSQRFPMQAIEYPCYLLLKQLGAGGWIRDASVTAHVLASDVLPDAILRYNCSNPTKRHHYFKCLLNFPALILRGLETLPAVGHDSFFRCVLLSADPASVKIRGKVSEYEALLGLSEDPPLSHTRLAMTLFDGADPLPEDDLIGEQDGQGCDEPLGDQPGEEDAANDNAEPVMSPPTNPSSSSGTSSSASSSDTDSECPVGGSTSSVLPQGYIDGLDLMSRVPDFIEGVRVRKDPYMHARSGTHYTRIGVQCPLHKPMLVGGSKITCFRWRNCEARQRMDLCEADGPVSYLTLWLQEATEYHNAIDHKAFKPDEDAVRTLASALPARPFPALRASEKRKLSHTRILLTM
jgi:hypothetical protein